MVDIQGVRLRTGHSHVTSSLTFEAFLTGKWISFAMVMPCGSVSFSRSMSTMTEDLNPVTSREPAPTHNYTRISIGDVGFIRRGQFHLLFSAGCPLGERQLGEDVPATFEELSIGTPVFGQPRLPICLRTDTVREVGVGVGATVSATLYVPPIE